MSLGQCVKTGLSSPGQPLGQPLGQPRDSSRLSRDNFKLSRGCPRGCPTYFQAVASRKMGVWDNWDNFFYIKVCNRNRGPNKGNEPLIAGAHIRARELSHLAGNQHGRHGA